MYDTMQYIHPEIHTICMGQAASMGSLLLAGGSDALNISIFKHDFLTICEFSLMDLHHSHYLVLSIRGVCGMQISFT